MREKLHAHQIDSVIIALEIPDRNADPVLQHNMVCGPCGALHHKSHLLHDKMARPLKTIQVLAQLNDKGYPLYQRRSPSDGGFTGQISMTYAQNLTLQDIRNSIDLVGGLVGVWLVGDFRQTCTSRSTRHNCRRD